MALNFKKTREGRWQAGFYHTGTECYANVVRVGRKFRGELRFTMTGSVLRDFGDGWTKRDLMNEMNHATRHDVHK